MNCVFKVKGFLFLLLDISLPVSCSERWAHLENTGGSMWPESSQWTAHVVMSKSWITQCLSPVGHFEHDPASVGSSWEDLSRK